MKIKSNKLIKVNNFDVLDIKALEKYLSKMALEGWMIKNINKVFLTFEKVNPVSLNFFVNIIQEKHSVDEHYINKLKEENLEYICSDNEFEIFINKGNEKNIDISKFKFTKLFMNEINFFSCILLSSSLFLFGRSFTEESFIHFISDKFSIILALSIFIVILFNLILCTLKVREFINIKKRIKDNLKEETRGNYLKIFKKFTSYANGLFLVVAVIILLSSFANLENITKDEIPLKLEDLNVDIQETREYDGISRSSYFAKYKEYSDCTYKEIKKEVYDKESNSYHSESSNEKEFYLNYEIFESKYSKLMDKALNSFLRRYNAYIKFEKVTDKNELKNWGAKDVYKSDYIYDRLVVYDNKIIAIGSGLKYNKKNIDIILKKLL